MKHKKQTLSDILEKWNSGNVPLELKEAVSAIIGMPTYKCMKTWYGYMYDWSEVQSAFRAVARCLPPTRERHYHTMDFIKSVLDGSTYFWTYRPTVYRKLKSC